MKDKLFASLLFLKVIVIISCAGQNNSVFMPVPEDADYIEPEKTIEMANIIETKNGVSISHMPPWMSAYINGGVPAVEKMDTYNGKYIFVGIGEGINFFALNKWAENFTVDYDFTMLAASRIEKKLISSASLYPDYEYGNFYETMVKKAYSTVYTGAIKEDTYWIKLRNEEGDIVESMLRAGPGIITTPSEVFNFFILVSIDKGRMQSVISNMMAEAIAAVNPVGSQRNAVNRLRQSFFESF